jgi:FAD/FMN-containing dehydrogenase
MARPVGPRHGGGVTTLRRAAPPPSLDGVVRFDATTRAMAADDFGRIVHRMPHAVVRPGSAADVVTAVRWATGIGCPVAAQGQRHSVWGRSQADAGVVIDTADLHAVGAVGRDRVIVDAGATWSDVLTAALPHGLTPPVLTEYLHLSVGGTLAVGGVGATTSTFGVQCDNVIELDVVTGRGDLVACSVQRNADLFDAVRAGLGQTGVITRATLRLVAAPRSVRRFQVSYPDLTTLLADSRLLAQDNRFDAVQGAILPAPAGGWIFRLDLAAYVSDAAPDDDALLAGLSDDPARRQPTTLTYLDYVSRMAALESALRANGQWFHPHPWLATFVGDSRVESVVSAELGRLDPAADLGEFGQIVLSPIRRAAITSPLLRLPQDDLCFTVNLLRIPTAGDLDAGNRLVASNRAVYERIRQAGGTLYPVSAMPMSPDDWRHHFGPAYERLADAKRRHDPAGLLTPGYEIFPGAQA